MALQVAGAVIDEHMDGEFATVVLAVHDPATASLTYACAGHPAPIIVGPVRPEPILAGSSPPVGLGSAHRPAPDHPAAAARVGRVPLHRRSGRGADHRGILGRPRLGDILAEFGRDATAAELLDASRDGGPPGDDDMATCLVPTASARSGRVRVEELEVEADEVATALAAVPRRVRLTPPRSRPPWPIAGGRAAAALVPRPARWPSSSRGAAAPSAQVVPADSGPSRTSIFPVF